MSGAHILGNEVLLRALEDGVQPPVAAQPDEGPLAGTRPRPNTCVTRGHLGRKPHQTRRKPSPSRNLGLLRRGSSIPDSAVLHVASVCRKIKTYRDMSCDSP